jgi:hypothetical protein
MRVSGVLLHSRLSDPLEGLLHSRGVERLLLEINLKLDLEGEGKFIHHDHSYLPVLTLELLVGLLRRLLQLTQPGVVKLLHFLLEGDVVVGNSDELISGDILLIHCGAEFADEDGEGPADQPVDVVEVEAVVPAGDGELKDVVDELEEIGHAVSRQVPLAASHPALRLALLDPKVVVLPLLHHDPQDDRLKVPETGSHVHLTQFLHGVLQLRILHVAVD